MKKIKPFFLAAKSKKAQHTLKVLSQKYSNYDLKEANTVVVLGGDGTILSLINDEVYLKKKIMFLKLVVVQELFYFHFTKRA